MKKLLVGLGFSVVMASGLFANSLMMATNNKYWRYRIIG